MKKYVFSTLCGLLLMSLLSTAQKSETVNDDINAKMAQQKKDPSIVRAQLTREDRSTTIEITGVGTSSFAVSNKFDGTSNSYKHALNITVPLLIAGANKENYQLVFYSPESPSAYAASTNAGVTNIYYPVSLYDGIKLKIDQTLAAKKKIQLKVTQRTDGFSEAVLIL